mgnify:CR=1 FL=1
MKVLLIDPPATFLRGDGVTRHLFPLGLGAISAVLTEEGHTVRVLLPDTRSYRGDDPWGVLEGVIAEEAPDLVGVTGMTGTFGAAVKVVDSVRRVLGPDVTVLMGGTHATFCVDEAVRVPGVDVVVKGEGEDQAVSLVNGFEKQGKSFDPLTVPGVAVLRDGMVCHSPTKPPRRDLDNLPWSRREGLVWDELRHPLLYQSLITTRGCPYKCTYCGIPNATDRLTRYRSPKDALDEIAFLREAYGVEDLTFYDPVFTLNRRRTLAFMKQMVERDLAMPFTCQTRADRVQADVAEAMAQAGCTRVFFGIESGDENSLAKMKKHMSLDAIRSGVKIIQDAGIGASGFFIVGFPWETEALVEQTVDFALSLGLDMVNLFSLTPLPGSELWQGALEGPKKVDFRGTQRNLTSLSDEDYFRCFSQAKSRFEEYNHKSVQSRMSHWPGALPDQAMPPKLPR